MKKQIKTGILLMIISMLLCVTCMAEENTVSSIVSENTVNDDTPRIGIISAMSNEISLLLDNAQIEYVKKIGNEDYHVGKLCGREVVITKSGIGKALSASGATAMLNNFNITEVLFTGIAGGVGDDTQVLDIVVATDLVQHDYGMISNDGFEWSEGEIGNGYYPCSTDLVDLAYDSASDVVGVDHVFKGTIATGDQFVASEDYVSALQNKFNAIACEMEGASIALVCTQYEIPFVVIRSMSDKADGLAHETIKNMGDEAANNSGRIIMKMLEEGNNSESGKDEDTLRVEQAKALLEKEDYKAAIPLLEKAVEQGSAEAQNELGKCYYNGTGVEQNYEEALKYFQMAADQGYAKSQNNVANYYAEGNVVEQNYEKAFEYYKLAADQGQPNAQFNIGYYFQNGIGVEQNLKEAVKYYKLAADQGHADAQNNLAICYLNGTGILQDYEEAVKYLLLAAEQGNAAAQNSLGYCYSEGLGVEEDDEIATKYYELAADQGDPDGIYNIGYSYYYGEGIEQDYQKAWDLFHQGAEMGQANALFLVGECYYEGKAVEKDLEKAAEWYQKALDAGYEPDETDKEHLKEVLGENYSAKSTDSVPDQKDDTEETDSQISHIVGGWEIIPHEAEALPEDAQDAFDKAVEGGDGTKYTPVKLMATQVVAGTNYCILCQVSPKDEKSAPKWALVYIYADLQGNAEIMNVYELYIDRHSGLVETEKASSDDILDSETEIETNNGSETEISRELLIQLNRSELDGLGQIEGPVYVFGHQSPDSDTVGTSIAYAYILRQLGYDAHAMVLGAVNRETAYILKAAGVVTPPLLEDAAGKNVVLIDHSEYTQSAEGLKDANVIMIIDHHGDGSVTTGNQLIYDARPLGSTATIAWIRSINYGVELDRQTALVMLGAILSDTSNLVSQTTTEADREAVRILSVKAGIEDVDAFYKEMYKESISYEGMTDAEILRSDMKKYEADGTSYIIGVVQVYDENEAQNMTQRMKDVLPEIMESEGVKIGYAQISIFHDDISINYIVPSDETAAELLETAFGGEGVRSGDAYVFRPGFSRKKILVPKLNDALSLHPQE